MSVPTCRSPRHGARLPYFVAFWADSRGYAAVLLTRCQELGEGSQGDTALTSIQAAAEIELAFEALAGLCRVQQVHSLAYPAALMQGWAVNPHNCCQAVHNSLTLEFDHAAKEANSGNV